MKLFTRKRDPPLHFSCVVIGIQYMFMFEPAFRYLFRSVVLNWILLLYFYNILYYMELQGWMRTTRRLFCSRFQEKKKKKLHGFFLSCIISSAFRWGGRMMGGLACGFLVGFLIIIFVYIRGIETSYTFLHSDHLISQQVIYRTLS